MRKANLMRRTKTTFISWISLILAILTLIYGALIGLMVKRTPSDGASGYLDATGYRINLPPASSNLLRNDVVLEINGIRVDAAPLYPVPDAFTRLPPGADTALYVVARGEEIVTVQVPWTPQPLERLLPQVGGFLLLGIAFVASALFLFINRAQDPTAPLIALGFALEGLNLINNAWTGAGANVFLSRAWLSHPLDLLSLAPAFGVMLHVFLRFPERKVLFQRRRLPFWLLHLFNLLLALATIVGLGGPTLYAGRTRLYGGLVYPWVGVQLLLAIASLTHTYFTSRKPGVRNQIRWLVWGLITGSLPWLVLYNLPQIFQSPPLIPLWLASFPTLLIPLSFIFSVTRRGLMLVDPVINRSIVYATIILLMAVVYFISAPWIDALLISVLGTTDPRTHTLLIILVVAFSAAYLRKYVQGWVDRLFFKQHLDFETGLHEIGEQLSVILDSQSLQRLLEVEIPNRLRITQAHLLLQQPDGALHTARESQPLTIPTGDPLLAQLSAQDSPVVLAQTDATTRAAEGWALALPLHSGGRLIGAYLMGARRSGDLYTPQELNTLTMVGRQLAATLENIQLYQEIKRYNENLEALVAERTQALAQERDQLNVILDNIVDGLLVTTPTQEVILANPAFSALTGQPLPSAPGLPLAKLLPELIETQILEWAVENPGEVYYANFTLHERVLHAAATALEKAPAIVTVLRDITHEIQADRMKTEFITTIAHELRTPLTSVLGFTKLIDKLFERDVLPHLAPDEQQARCAVARIRDNLDIILSEGDRLTRLINNVLDVSRMESGEIEWNDTLIDWQFLVEKVVKAQRLLIDKKGLTLHVAVPPTLPQVYADPQRILQLLTNLFSNAVKYTEKGEIRLTLRSLAPGARLREWQVPATGGVEIVIRDTGSGIAPDLIPRIFQRYQRVSLSAMRAQVRGTGLGLVICREIVTHYDGVIWVESTPGEGTRITCALPAHA